MEAAEYEKMYHFEDGNWWYQGRRELLIDIIDGIKLKLECVKILDAGCGTGLNLKFLDRYGEVIGLDISEDALYFTKLRGNSSLICASVDKLPLKSDIFQMICALDVLEHIDNDESAMREFYRVLEPGGYLILTVPAFKFLWSRHDIAAHHKRRYNKVSLIQSLRSCEFSVDKSTYWNFFLFLPVTLVRLFRKDEKQEIRTDLQVLPVLLNKVLLYVLRLEKAVISRDIALPVGVSILCICRKGCGEENAAEKGI